MIGRGVLRAVLAAAVASTGAGFAGSAAAATATLPLAPCRLKAVEHDALCGTLRRPLNPAQPGGQQIDIHVAVLPAIARNKKPDPLLFFAGGPGQSAIGLAGTLSRLYARALNRRDLILIDQRGTGSSAPLACQADAPTRPLADSVDPARQARQLAECREALQKLPYGDLRQFTTSIAVADADAVRAALGVAQVNLVGGSYGTRAALEYMRQFPRQVRRAVLDGVAPPDMALPGSFSPDTQRAFDALIADCDADARCRARYPSLRAQWKAALATLPREVSVTHPVTGREEHFVLTREMLLGLVRAPLYAPSLAAALPFAISEAAAGRFGAIVGLAASLGGGGKGLDVAMGMHFSVVCAEDMPWLGKTGDKPGPDFGESALALYREACEKWPRGSVPAGFYSVPPAPAATLLLSGGNDPATPPRHAERVARALGAKARHVVVPHAGHGTIPLGCMGDVVFRFIDQPDEAQALAAVAADAQCAAQVPRPTAFALPTAPGAPMPVWPPSAASAPKPTALPDVSRYSKADR
jgi:pimeloyl-ACP methyl ester carboxylesterase